MDDVIIPVAFFLILTGAIVAVAHFRTQRNRERDRQHAEAMHEYRTVVERARSELEATRLQLVEIGHRPRNVEGLPRSVDRSSPAPPGGCTGVPSADRACVAWPPV
ncbi:hypothetical protein SALBM135S_08059 [Streptomyces alboniger]